MPFYEFRCSECGPFEFARPMAEAAMPASCPTCGSEARRVYSPPRLTRLAASTRRALDWEEKSAHEPDVVTEKQGRPLPRRHAPTPPWVVHH
jgi:putative FmdB family regulatory protein